MPIAMDRRRVMFVAWSTRTGSWGGVTGVGRGRGVARQQGSREKIDNMHVTRLSVEYMYRYLHALEANAHSKGVTQKPIISKKIRKKKSNKHVLVLFCRDSKI